MPHLWLRAEAKPHEQRAALTPATAEELIASGHAVSVEECANRIFDIGQYRQAGCRIVPAASWQSAPPDCYVIGLKELPEPMPSLHHKHIYFAHAYKQQTGWKELLGKFAGGGGQLFDLEFLLDENGQRIAAFGYWAGFAGAALGVMNWLQQPETMGAIRSFPDKNQLLAEVADKLKKSGERPRVIIIGAKGRSGRGATELCQSLDIETTLWDMDETGEGGPFVEILEHDILVNCVLVQSGTRPFITNDLLEQQRLLSSVIDVSCDPYSRYNPLPVYENCTTFTRPALRLRSSKNKD